jgi:endonuclease/exonuclease/phosphatase family metal-dependent hydrolase
MRMKDEQLFRLILLAGFAILLPTGIFHRLHPFYTAAALMIPASFLLAANWFFLALGVAVFLLLAIRTRKEEENLIARFGDDYRNYRQRTGRFAPRSLRRFVLVGGVVLAVAAGHCLINRLFSPRNAVSVRTIQTPGFSPDARFDGTLKFAAFNIAHGRGTNEGNLSHRAGRRARLKAIAELLQQHQVDIAVLNEVDFGAVWTGHENQAEIIAREAGFAHLLEQRNFDAALPFQRLRFGNAILSRFPIKASQFVPLPAFSERERRIAGSKQGVLADIHVDDQLTIRAFAVHLEPRDELTRIRSAAAISACATNSPYPFFCLGDFNCSPASAEIESTSREPSAMDMLLKHGRLKIVPAHRLTPERFTFASFAPTVAIDWVLVPMDWEFISHEVPNVQLSDHRPVLAEVRK